MLEHRYGRESMNAEPAYPQFSLFLLSYRRSRISTSALFAHSAIRMFWQTHRDCSTSSHKIYDPASSLGVVFMSLAEECLLCSGISHFEANSKKLGGEVRGRGSTPGATRQRKRNASDLS